MLILLGVFIILDTTLQPQALWRRHTAYTTATKTTFLFKMNMKY